MFDLKKYYLSKVYNSMAPKKNIKTETPTTAVVVEPPVVVAETPVVVAVEPPVVAKQAGKKKEKVEKVEKVEGPVYGPEQESPVVKTTGKKKAGTPVVVKSETPVETPTETPVKQTGRKKVVQPVQPVLTENVEVLVKQKGGKGGKGAKGAKGGKGVKAGKGEKGVKKVKPETDATDATEVGEDDDEKKIRSFKVRLPDKEDFEGRFTGLTPYQAANKALSKYYREVANPLHEITFSICESTRKSKKNVYTYIGQRNKLDTPVRYKIQDGREIVKNFKNYLKKVKKVDEVSTQTPSSV